MCQILYEVKEENGDIFVWESGENGWPGNVKANENGPVAWQVGAWTFDQMCLANTSRNSFIALYRSSMSQVWNPNLVSWGTGQRYLN